MWYSLDRLTTSVISAQNFTHHTWYHLCERITSPLHLHLYVTVHFISRWTIISVHVSEVIISNFILQSCYFLGPNISIALWDTLTSGSGTYRSVIRSRSSTDFLFYLYHPHLSTPDSCFLPLSLCIEAAHFHTFSQVQFWFFFSLFIILPALVLTMSELLVWSCTYSLRISPNMTPDPFLFIYFTHPSLHRTVIVVFKVY